MPRWRHSRPEHDTIFELGLTVPLADEADLPTHLLVDNYNVQSHLDGQGRVLLVAEDNADIRDMLTTEPENHGFRVVSYADGQPLIEHLNTHRQPWPDLILTDLQMPIADGFAVLASAQRQTPPPLVVVLSATPPNEDSGFQASLLKPISMAFMPSCIHWGHVGLQSNKPTDAPPPAQCDATSRQPPSLPSWRLWWN